MKLSSAEGAKLLKKLKSEYDALKSKESISSTFLVSEKILNRSDRNTIIRNQKPNLTA